jgi:hypothetical protein
MPTPRIGSAVAWQIAAIIAVAIRPCPQSPFFDNRKIENKVGITAPRTFTARTTSGELTNAGTL